MRKFTHLKLQRRRQQRIKKFKIILGVLVLASLGATTILTSKFLYQKISPILKKSSIFHLKRVVAAATEHVTEAELVSSAKSFYGKNIFEIDLDQLSKKIKQHPWVLDANITRILPDRLRIHINEKKPFSILSMERLYFLDHQAKIIAEIRPNEDLNFPVISGVSPEEYKKGIVLLKAYQIIKIYHQNAYLKDWPLSEIHWKQKSGFVLFTSNPSFEVRLGKSGFLDKSIRLEKVLKDLSQKSLIPKLVDLNFTKKVVVKLSK